jgi:hypothetical protein
MLTELVWRSKGECSGSIQFVEYLLFELGCDVRKYAIQLGADAVSGGNNNNRKSTCDQRIFDGGGSRLVRKEHSELSDHGGSIGMSIKDSINGNARIRTLQNLN